MRSNSIEKRNLVEKLDSTSNSRFYPKKSRYNPQSTTSILLPSTLPSPKNLKRCDSAVSIRSRKSDNINNTANLQSKYRVLEQSYRKLAADMSGKNEVYARQKSEIEKLNAIHEKNQKELLRLRGMLGFLQKTDKSTQIEQNASDCKRIEHYEPGYELNTQSYHQVRDKEHKKPCNTNQSVNYDVKYLTTSSSTQWLPTRNSKMKESRRRESNKKMDKPERSPSCDLYKRKYKFTPSLKYL